MLLRSPRWVLLDLTSARPGAARRLADFLASWDIPTELRAEESEVDPEPAGRAPVGPPRITRHVLALDRLPAGEWVETGSVRRTYLRGAAVLYAARVCGPPGAHPLLAWADRTRTPVVLVLPARGSAAGSRWADLADAVLFSGPPGAPPGRPSLGALDPAATGADLPGFDLPAFLELGLRAPELSTPDPPGGGGARAPGGSAPRPAGRRRAGAAVLMLQGTHSAAGKSFLTAALARNFANRGIRVAPFKGQNLSNNARVARGGEISVAQYLQALAARVEPDVRMNPVLLKPESGRTYAITLGRPRPELTRLPWRHRKPVVWPVVRAALAELREEYDLVLIEGAGSAAEPTIYHNDVVNMRVAREVSAPTVLVTDADRGGAVAHCYGTWALLPPEDRALLRGVIYNRYHGSPQLLHEAGARLTELTGLLALGVVPRLEHHLPDEDTTGAELTRDRGDVVVVRYPYLANFDEFEPLQPAGVRWARRPADLDGARLVVLPGSKDVAADLAWLRESGLADAVTARAAAGGLTLGVCGGLQMLGLELSDVDGRAGVRATGLGLLPLRTGFSPDKRQDTVTCRFADLPEPWRGLSGVEYTGYEIRHGRTGVVPGGEVAAVLPGGRGFAAGPVLGVYTHGMFENAAVLRALGDLGPGARLDRTFDALAAAMDEHVDVDRLLRLAGL